MIVDEPIYGLRESCVWRTKVVTRANKVVREFFIGPQWRRTHRHIWSSEHKIDNRDAVAILQPASEFVRLNGQVNDLAS